MGHEANGSFEVRIMPDTTSGDGIGCLSVDKTFHGGIEGKSVGKMLAVRTRIPGSAGYVLIEHVTARVDGKSGGFMLQHSGVMDRGSPDLKVTSFRTPAPAGSPGSPAR